MIPRAAAYVSISSLRRFLDLGRAILGEATFWDEELQAAPQAEKLRRALEVSVMESKKEQASHVKSRNHRTAISVW